MKYYIFESDKGIIYGKITVKTKNNFIIGDCHIFVSIGKGTLKEIAKKGVDSKSCLLGVTYDEYIIKKCKKIKCSKKAILKNKNLVPIHERRIK